MVFYLYEVVSEYAKSIFSCTENTFKAYKSNRRIRQEYLAAFGEFNYRHKTELISANFRPKQKNSAPNNFLYITEWAKNQFQSTVPLQVPTCEILDLLNSHGFYSIEFVISFPKIYIVIGI